MKKSFGQQTGSQQHALHRRYQSTLHLENVSRFPVLNQINTKVAELVSGAETARSKSNNTSIWLGIPNAATSREKYDHLQQALMKQPIDEQLKSKLNHLMVLCQELADEFSFERLEQVHAMLLRVVKYIVSHQQKQARHDTSSFISIDFKKLIEEKHQEKEREKPKDEQKDLKQRFLDLQLINHKLKQEIELLSQKLESIEKLTDVNLLKRRLENIQMESDHQIKVLLEDQKLKEKMIIRLNQNNTSLKSTCQRLEAENMALQTFNEQFKSEERKYKEQIEHYSAQYNKWRENALMAREDILALKIRQESQLSDQRTLFFKVQKLQQKLDRLNISRSREVEVPPEQYEQHVKELIERFTKDTTFMAIMKQTQDREFEKKNKQVQESFSPQRRRGSIFATLKQDERLEVELQQYQYNRQGFMLFFPPKPVEMEMKNLDTRRIPNTYFATIRHILDAKYNEYLYNTEYSQASRFPDFVYSWISNFTINKTTKKLEKINSATLINPEDMKLQFLMDCLNPRLEALQECAMFNSFLFEQASSDELYFYLHCRYMVFRGPCCDSQSALFEVIQTVRVEFAELVVELIMSKYDAHNMQLVKKTLREKSHRNFVDAYFLLRILLEFYKIERRNRLKMLKDIFQPAQYLQLNGRLGVNFKNFRNIMELNFPMATDLEMAFLYRESYMLGQGGVTAESFFAAATEHNFFLRHLQFKSLLTTPQVDSNELILYNEDNVAYIEFYRRLATVPEKHLEVLRSLAFQFGLEKVQRDLDEYDVLVKMQFQDPWVRRPLLMLVHRMLHTWLTLRNIKVYHLQLKRHPHPGISPAHYKLDVPKIPQPSEFQVLQDDLSNLDAQFACLEQFERAHRLEEIEANARIRKFQALVRKRIAKFYGFVGSVMIAKLKA